MSTEATTTRSWSPPEDDVRRLAARFSEEIRLRMTREQFAEVVERNRFELRRADAGEIGRPCPRCGGSGCVRCGDFGRTVAICHTHDVVDANLAMDAAFRRLHGHAPRELDSDRAKERACATWNAAWDRAKAVGFDRARALYA